MFIASPIDGKQCGIPTTSFDIYIFNKSDQALNLTSNEVSAVDSSGNTITPITNCWLSPPPATINANSETFIRANIIVDECTENITASVKLVYGIGSSASGFGNLEINLCRVQPMGESCGSFTCTTGYGALGDGCSPNQATITGGMSGNPYSLSDINSAGFQFTVTVNGSSGDDILPGASTETFLVIGLAVFFVLALVLGFLYYLYSLRR
jgi:hypothetical protein